MSLANAVATARLLQRTGYNVARVSEDYPGMWAIWISPGKGESYKEPRPWYKYQPGSLLLAA